MGSHRGVVSRRGPQPTGSYPHAHIQGKLVWVTAQAGRDPVNGELVEGGMRGQMDQAITNLQAILEECRSSLERVVRTQIMYTDPADVEAMDEAYARRRSHACERADRAEPGPARAQHQKARHRNSLARR